MAMAFTINDLIMNKTYVLGGLILAASLTAVWHWSQPTRPRTASAISQPSAMQSGQGKHSAGRHGGDRPTTVSAAVVKLADVPVSHSALGTVIPSAVVTVTSRVAGQLVQVAFEEGQLVKKGQLLAKIDPRPFETALAQIQGQAMRNQALLKNSQIDLERFKTLQAQDSIASQQVDAQASLVQQYQGTVQADHAAVESAKLQLAFTQITAPISGRIGLRQVDTGNNIATTNPIAVINAVHPIQVVFTLPEDKISPLVQASQSSSGPRKLKVEAWDKSNTQRLATGVLASLDNQIDTTSGTLKLKAEFANPDQRLFPNQFVNVRLYGEPLRQASVIPLNALQYGPDGAFVYKIVADQRPDNRPAPEAGRAKSDGADAGRTETGRGPAEKVIVQPVVVGHRDAEIAAIIQGLSAGDRVVSSGVDKLKPGAKVRVKAERSAGEDTHAQRDVGSEAATDAAIVTRVGATSAAPSPVAEHLAKATLATDAPATRRRHPAA